MANGPGERRRVRKAFEAFGLAGASLAVSLLLMEIGYRLLDPFEYIDPSEINHSEHGGVYEYDAVLGWRGAPGAEAALVTANRRVGVRHNRQGFRDVEHPLAARRPLLVFLGDSFAWGFEVEADEMLVTRVRRALPDFEVVNLAHRGYGTDQALLAFESWAPIGALRLVVLVFSENDVIENNARFAYGSHKPRFEVQGGELVAPGPVPRVDAWDRRDPPPPAPPAPGWRRWILRSHLASEIAFRIETGGQPVDHPALFQSYAPDDLERTRALLARLRERARERGGRLVVAFVPSKLEVEDFDGYEPYQAVVAALCAELGIASLDPADALEATRWRTYHRLGMHWNATGHRVAADALLAWLARERLLEPSLEQAGPGGPTGESAEAQVARLEDSLDEAADDASRSEILVRLGVALSRLRRRDQAVARLQEAASLAPGAPAPRLLLAAEQVALGRDAEAAGEYREILRLSPDAADVRSLLGAALERQGDAEAALAEYERAAALAPDFVPASFQLGRLRLARGDAAGAIPFLERAAAAEPGVLDAHALLALAYRSQGRPGDAIASYERALELEPGSARLRGELAAAWIEAGRAERAIEELRIGVAKSPNAAPLLESLAWLLATHPDAERRAPAEALRLAERAAALDPGPRSLDALAAARAAAGRFEAAVAEAERARRAAERAGDAALAREIARRAAGYAAGVAWVEAPRVRPPVR